LTSIAILQAAARARATAADQMSDDELLCDLLLAEPGKAKQGNARDTAADARAAKLSSPATLPPGPPPAAAESDTCRQLQRQVSLAASSWRLQLEATPTPLVADTLVALVQDAPGGEFNAARLCKELYRKHPGAKAVVQKYQGFRSFIETPELKGRLRFVADAVWAREGLC
jgi:hypothetical protein